MYIRQLRTIFGRYSVNTAFFGFWGKLRIAELPGKLSLRFNNFTDGRFSGMMVKRFSPFGGPGEVTV